MDGCVYCEAAFNPFELIEFLAQSSLDIKVANIDCGSADVNVFINSDGKLVLNSENFDGKTLFSTERNINYCPMCGRKLKYEDGDRVKIENARFDLNDPTFIDHLGLSIRSYNSLKRAGILSINDFCNLTADSLKKVRNLGRHSYVEIANVLKENGVIISDILLEAAKI